MTIAALETILLAPAKTGGGGIHLSTELLIIIGIILGVGVLAIIGWREGGLRAQKDARDAERNREVD
jgi:hypothetical protein